MHSHLAIHSRTRQSLPKSPRVFLEIPTSPAHNVSATRTGGVVEWSIAPVLKTGEPQGSVGSNPTPSAIY